MQVLLVRMDVLGDAVVSSAFIESLSTTIPQDSKIDVLCHYYNYPAFKFHPLISNTYVLNHKQGTKALADDYKIVLNQVNKTLYDLVLVLNGCIRTYYYASLIKSSKIIARRLVTKSFKSKVWMLKQQFSQKIIFFAEDYNQHEVIRLHKFLDFILSILKIASHYQISSIARFYPVLGFEVKVKDNNSIMINASGKKEVARYLNDSLLCSLISILSRQEYNKIAIISTPEDATRIKGVLKDIDSNVEVVLEPDLFKLGLLISEYGYFIGADGGLAHIAAGLGLKCITLFDKQDKNIWHPWSPTQVSLQSLNHNIYDISYIDILSAINKLEMSK